MKSGDEQAYAARQVLAGTRANDYAGVQPSIGDSVSRYHGWAEGNPDLCKADRGCSSEIHKERVTPPY